MGILQRLFGNGEIGTSVTPESHWNGTPEFPPSANRCETPLYIERGVIAADAVTSIVRFLNQNNHCGIFPIMGADIKVEIGSVYLEVGENGTINYKLLKGKLTTEQSIRLRDSVEFVENELKRSLGTQKRI